MYQNTAWIAYKALTTPWGWQPNAETCRERIWNVLIKNPLLPLAFVGLVTNHTTTSSVQPSRHGDYIHSFRASQDDYLVNRITSLDIIMKTRCCYRQRNAISKRNPSHFKGLNRGPCWITQKSRNVSLETPTFPKLSTGDQSIQYPQFQLSAVHADWHKWKIK
jgi:hypothetical protein